MFKSATRLMVVVAASSLALLGSLSCSTVALTGRHQLTLVPESEMLSVSQQQYGQFLSENKVSTDADGNARLQRVGARISKAVEDYAKQTDHPNALEGYKWEFKLVESKEVNAWCMPGGKVVFYTGILPVCKDDDGMAVVMGLEVALHSKPQETQQMWMGAFGAGAQYGLLLPFGRGQESEADHLGLIFMAMAGYDPHHAVEFWQRMAAQGGGEKPPEFMSTHPSDEKRIAAIQQELPEALKYYKAK